MDENILREARAEIAEIDREMARLFVRRMEAVRKIAAYKRENGLPILDAAQQARVIERNLTYIEGDELHELYTRFIQGLMDVSKEYQRRLQAD